MSMVLERLAVLAGKSAQQAGMFFPYQVLDHTKYFECLAREGGRLMTLPLE